MSGAAQIAPSQDAARSEITRAIERAAAGSHTPFGTLVAIAGAESGFHVNAQNKLSSAAGPFQITESTWLHLVKKYGAAAGRPDLAARVHQDANGHLSVVAGDKSAVLGARHNIELASKLAARFCDECRSGLAQKLGRPPSEEDVRLAYFLGVNGATRLISAAAQRPAETMRALLPHAYASNRGVFSQHGRALNAGQALSALQAKFSTQIAQGDALKSYAGANALAESVGVGSDASALASADAAASVFAAAATAANVTRPETLADAGTEAVTPDTAAPLQDGTSAQPAAAAPSSTAPSSTAIVQTASAGGAKALACKPEADGGVSCAL